MRSYHEEPAQRMYQERFPQATSGADIGYRASVNNPESTPGATWDTAVSSATGGVRYKAGPVAATPGWPGAVSASVDGARHCAGTTNASAVRPDAGSSAAFGFWHETVSPAVRAAWHMAGSLAALGALLLCDVAAVCTPAYRPSTRSTITPYVGHSFGFLRTFIDVRPQVVFAALSDGVRLVGIL